MFGDEDLKSITVEGVERGLWKVSRPSPHFPHKETEAGEMCLAQGNR